MLDRTTSALARLFRPEVFFLGRTEGWGVVRDPFGRITRRCEIVTEGRAHTAFGAIHLTETFTHDDGLVDVWRWVMTDTGRGRYVAAEARSGAGLVGERRGDDYRISLRRPLRRLRGLLTPTFTIRLTLLTPDLALIHAQARLFGLPVGEMTGVHRRVAAQ